MCKRTDCFNKLHAVAPILRNEFGVNSLCIFGSIARGDYSTDSDIDVFVDMPPKAMQLLSLKNYLQDLLGMAVDIVRKHPNLDPFLLRLISRDGVYIF
ncbi:MAG: nucleotidyltransferase domain-containing protein [Muribaculaceae bacterium]|nr:nucleotidyltransferase domain-containing protein [Muribaculaceae bacterium]